MMQEHVQLYITNKDMLMLYTCSEETNMIENEICFFCSLLSTFISASLKGCREFVCTKSILHKLHKRSETNIIAANICLFQEKVFRKEAEVELKNLGRHCSEYLARAT